MVARDSASGTRGAFHVLMKIKVKENSTEVDKLVVGVLEFDGTGLGLSIVKHIVEVYDGTIEIKSKENLGTEIALKFPQK